MTTRTAKPKPQTLKEKLADRTYQPTKAEQNEECDMPGASPEQIRAVFFTPRDAMDGQ